MKMNKGIAVALTAAILASGGGVTSALIEANPAHAASTQQEIDVAVQRILTDTNAERAKEGLAPLRLAPKISVVAQGWSEQMAAQQTMVHNPNYHFDMPSGWLTAGENVAQGYTPSTVVQAWMNSQTHRQNIMSTGFTHIGLGYWVDDKGRAWFTQNFASYQTVEAPTVINTPTNTVGRFDFTSSWTPKTGEYVTDYKAELYSSAGTLLQTKTVTSPTVTFSGLTDLTTYTVKVTARAADKAGLEYFSPVKTYNVTTLENLPTVTAPTNLTLDATENSIEALWQAPSSVNGTLQPYKVELFKGAQLIKSTLSDYPNYTFDNLASNTEYTVVVTATSQVGQKTATSTATQKKRTALSAEAEVTEPQNVVVTAPTAKSVKATWTAPETVVGTGLKYIITLSTAGKPNVVVETTSLTHTFTDLTANTAYKVNVQAYIVSEDSSNELVTTGVLKSISTPIDYEIVEVSAPALTNVAIAPKQATLSWTAPETVEGRLANYTVTVKSTGQADRVLTVAGTATSYVVTGLLENTTYTFELKANAESLNGANKRASSPVSDTKTTPYAPNTVIVSSPRTLSAKAASYDRVDVTWAGPTTVVGTLTGYKVTVKNGNTVVQTKTVTGTSASFTGLPDNTAYTVEVSALATSPDGTANATSTPVNTQVSTPVAVTATVPTNARATNIGFNDIAIAWTAPTGYIGTLADYTVTVKEAGKADRVLKTPGTSMNLTGLSEAVNYTIEVRANVVSFDGSRTATSTAATIVAKTIASPMVYAPNEPANFKASALTNTEATFTWAAPTGVIGKLENYTITVKQAGKADRVFNTTATSYKVTGLTENTSYLVEIVGNAVSNDGANRSSTPTASVSVVTPFSPEVSVSAPTGLKAGAVAHNEATVSWTAPTGTVGTLVDYNVIVKETGKADRVFKTASTSYKVTGLSENTSYTVLVSANAVARDGVTKATSATVSLPVKTVLSPVAAAPNAPTNVTASGVTTDAATVSWAAPTGVVGKIASYKVILREAGKADRVFITLGTSYDLTGLSDGTSYTVLVSANAVSNDGANQVTSPAGTATVKTLASPLVSVPNAPTALKASSVTSSEATFTWTAPTGVVGKIVDYTFTVVETGKPNRTFTTAATSYKVTGLTEDTSYTVYVKANAVSNDGANRASGPATSVAVKTPFNAAAVSVSAPTNVKASTVTDSSVAVSWTKPATVTGTITGYKVSVKNGSTVVKTVSVPAASLAATVTGLDEVTDYTVVVEANAVAANGVNTDTAASTATAFKTLLSEASTVNVGVPASLVATANTNTATVTWQAPAVTGKITGYVVSLKQGDTVVKSVTTTSLKVVFTGLPEGTAYTVEVTANASSSNDKYKDSSVATKDVQTTVAVAVTPATPSFNSSGLKYTIPTKAGVQYYANGVAKAAGTYSVGWGKLSITAKAKSGYKLSGTASWTHDYVRPATPSIRKGDQVAIDSRGRLWNYGNPSGARKLIGSGGWQAMKEIHVTDWNQDGIQDIIALAKKGQLYFYKGNKYGGFSRYTIGSSGWSGYDLDVAKWKKTDKYPSIIAKHRSTGKLYVYGNTSGYRLAPRYVLGSSGWKNLHLTLLDWDRDGNMDAIVKFPNGSGQLKLYRTNGKGKFVSESRKTIGSSGWDNYTLYTSNGYGNRSGQGIFAKHTNGTLYHYNAAKNRWEPRDRIGGGWSHYTVANQG